MYNHLSTGKHLGRMGEQKKHNKYSYETIVLLSFYTNSIMLKQVTGKTKLLGLLGSDIEHSLSYQIHNFALTRLQIDALYLPLKVNNGQLQGAVQGLRSMHFMGANVTIPFKEQVIPLLDSLSPAAKAIGAVNTIYRSSHGFLSGDNTDAQGFIDDIKHHNIDVTKRDIIILGAGGAAKAISYSLAKEGANKLLFYNRSPSRITSITKMLYSSFPQQKISIIHDLHGFIPGKHDMIINCTPVGTHDTASLWPHPFHAQQIAIDLLYRNTNMLRTAQRAGAACFNGKGMLIRQAMLSMKRWTGRSLSYHDLAQLIVHNS